MAAKKPPPKKPVGKKPPPAKSGNAPAKVDPKTGKPVPPAGAEAQAPPWAKKKKK